MNQTTGNTENTSDRVPHIERAAEGLSITPSAHTRATLTIEQAAQELGVSRQAGYGAAARGEIPTIRIGRRLLVPRAAFNRLLGQDA